MSLATPILLFLAGLVLIILAGDRFVDAAVAIAKRFGISEVIIGATIVSLGTTLPEILVSSTAALSGSADIAFGNAFGSIICNTAFVAGITQLIKPTRSIDRPAFAWRTGFFFLALAACFLFGKYGGSLGLIAGTLLIGMFAVYAYINITATRPNVHVESPGDKPEKKGLSSAALQFAVLALSAAVLFIGARLLVDNGIVLAEAIGIPERVIGVTFIALGTSLPELVTAISSIVKGHSAVSVGNILGANILNCLLVIGIPAVICGITPSETAILVDIPVAAGVMALLTVPMLIAKRGLRIQGILLVAAYILYCLSQF